MDFSRKLPIGIQSFEDLRRNEYLYVDKTEDIFNLVHSGKVYFLSRPRRFGKSLLISTLEAYFEGKKELFEGLAIVELEKNNPDAWKPYPVLHFDFNGKNYTQEDALKKVIVGHLEEWEETYGTEKQDCDIEERFAAIIKNAYNQTGQQVVVLVDEYDKSLLETINSDLDESNRAVFKGLFGQLKRMDAYLKFVLFTGVTKFSKVSIFSDLNQLNDISLDSRFEKICGITQEELEGEFTSEIKSLAAKFKFTYEECLAELKNRYDGYHFSENMTDIYNPFSLLNAFDKKKFGNYWFETGTPTFLIKKLDDINFDPRTFEENIKASEDRLKDYRPENPDPVPLFYQSGYLTIKDFVPRQMAYMLGFPNAEVKYGFLNALAPTYLNVEDKPAPFNIDLLDDAVEAGDTDGIRKWFSALFALLPYPAGSDTESLTEQNFQNVIFISLVVLGKYARTEVHSAKGRADCIVETDDYVYVFEFKRDVSAKEALAQIEEQGYAKPYEADKRKLFKIGVTFSTQERNITDWKVIG